MDKYHGLSDQFGLLPKRISSLVTAIMWDRILTTLWPRAAKDLPDG